METWLLILDRVHDLRHTCTCAYTCIQGICIYLYVFFFFFTAVPSILCAQRLTLDRSTQGVCVFPWDVYVCSQHGYSPSQRAYNWMPCKLIRQWSHHLSFNKSPSCISDLFPMSLHPSASIYLPCREPITSMDTIPSFFVWKMRVETHSGSFSWTATLWVKLTHTYKDTCWRIQ